MTDKKQPWPEQCEAAISLTFDDGMDSQLAIAVPQLETSALRGTFYLNTRDDYRQKLPPWLPVLEAGHEIGNHTAYHPCSNNHAFVRASGRRSLEEMSLSDMNEEIALAQARLLELLPLELPNSFGYPCYHPFVGRGVDQQSYVPLIAEQFVAGRGWGGTANHPTYCDLAHLWSLPCERMAGAEMIGLVEQAAEQGLWLILTFHGINEGHLSVSEVDFSALCRHLERNHRRLWTAPLCTIAQAVSDWQHAT